MRQRLTSSKKNKKSFPGWLLMLCIAILAAACIYRIFIQHDANESYVSRANVSKQLALLGHSREDCLKTEEALPEDVREEQWYAPYVKTVLADGLLFNENNRFYPMKMLTYREAASIIQKLNIDSERLSFPIRTENLSECIPEAEWLEIFQLANEQYETLSFKDVFVVATSAVSQQLEPWQCLTDDGLYGFEGLPMDDLLYRKVRIAVRDAEAAAVLGVDSGVQTLEKVHFLQCSDDELQIQIGETEINLKTEKPLGKDIESADGSIIFENGSIKTIRLEQISGGEISEDDAALSQDIQSQNIRVLLSSDNFSGYIHGGVTLTSNENFRINFEQQEEQYDAGTVIELTPSDQRLSSGKATVQAENSGKIEVLSMNRGQGHPQYRGEIEISVSDGGLSLINELSLEEYLYAVLPSEMPVSYGLEALKVQAVCARSYTYKTIAEGGAFADFGADVDDSTVCQMYNNAGEDPLAVQAVDETKGQVLYSGDEPVKAYFFSISCGVTADVHDVWLSSGEIPYLEAGIQAAVSSGGTVQAAAQPDDAVPDLSDETAFRSFIDDISARDYYEKDIAWFRWSVHLDSADIRTSVESPTTLTVTKRGSSGVVMALTVGNDQNSVILEGEYAVREALSAAGKTITLADGSTVSNQTMLPSGYFYVDSDGRGGFNIHGGGFGHGVGMSQNGVAAMCGRGMDYESILNHYFKGTKIRQVS